MSRSVSAASSLCRRFEDGRLDPRTFTHRDHLEVAHGLLQQYEFLDAAARFAGTLQDMVAVGAESKYSTTVTVAFMALIAKRMAGVGAGNDAELVDFDAFCTANADLLDPAILRRFYSPARLNSELARAAFVLPDRAVGALEPSASGQPRPAAR